MILDPSVFQGLLAIVGFDFRNIGMKQFLRIGVFQIQSSRRKIDNCKGLSFA